MFDKRNELFPVKNEQVYLLHCGIAPLYSRAMQAEYRIAEEHQKYGSRVFEKKYEQILDGLHRAAGELIRTNPSNLSFVKNTSEGVSLIASGYRFSPGDQIIVYTHEYPANFYPWLLQERRGVEVVLLEDDKTAETDTPRPTSWSLDDLERLITKKTKIVALSHVQFTSGYAADLRQLGELCFSEGIDLVVDAAQSLGALPVYPEEMHIAALSASGWKWLLGPIGTGLMYTSEEFRERLDTVAAGAELMRQGTDYLNHRWNPHESARRFEYSTSPVSLAAALETSIREIPLVYGVEQIRRELFRLQELAAEMIDTNGYTPLVHPEKHRSGILSVVCKRQSADEVVDELEKHHVICSSRGGYLRLAPHFYNTDDEIEKAVGLLNAIR